MFAGFIVPHCSDEIPEGFLECDGTALSRDTYSKLFEAIETNWGDGDRTSTFNIPDLRGRFLRGWDHGAGKDTDAITRIECNSGGNSGDNVGSIQNPAIKEHVHNAIMVSNSIPAGSGIGTKVLNPDLTDQSTYNGGSESRPINHYCMYIIKY